MSKTMKKDEVQRYLLDTRSHYASYHNHKEASAWAGVVLFAALIPKTASYLGMPDATCGLKALGTLAVFVLLILSLIFVSKQFESRRFAANLVAASFALAAELLIKNEDEMAADEFAIEPGGDKDKQAPHALPKMLLSRAEQMDKQGSGIRKNLEVVGYLVLVGGAGLGLIRIWWPS